MRGKFPSSFERHPSRTQPEIVNYKVIYVPKEPATKPESSSSDPPVPGEARESTAAANATTGSESVPAKITASAAEALPRLSSPGSPPESLHTQSEPSPQALARRKSSSSSPRFRLNSKGLPDLDRHSRKCCICSHPDRDAIEGEFIRWACPRRIARDYQIADRASFYRHAHATGLYARRRREFARVLEDILECVEHSSLEKTADVIIRASRVYAHLDENGNWIEPRRTQVILTGPAPSQFMENPNVTVAVQPYEERRKIASNVSSRRDRSSMRKRKLIATADQARLLGLRRGGETILGLPRESTAKKSARPSRSGRICKPRPHASKRATKSTQKNKAGGHGG